MSWIFLVASWYVTFVNGVIVKKCNSTIEFGPNTQVKLENPKHTPGNSLLCWYQLKIIDGAGVDVLKIDVNRFSVGTLDKEECKGGHLQILDSKYDKVNEELGYHCGEAEQPQQIIRETRAMKLIFYVEDFNRLAEWDLRVMAVGKHEVGERYGSHPDRFPGKVGAVVEETYCETVFQDCRVQQCNVQSPGFPGVYPQGISCRYYISTKSSLIRLYVDRPYWEAFNVDGRRCDSLVGCPVRELTSDGDCPYDYIKLYDGVDEYSPLIGQFCGVGSFPVSIIGTSNKLFLEFVTSKHGPLINTGFDFRVTSIPGTGTIYENRSCHHVVNSRSLQGNEGSFISLEHWYEPGTNCSHLLKGTPNQVVRLHFQKMKITKKTPIKEIDDDCGEYLILYDSDWADPQRIIKAFCSKFSQPKENLDFITTGPNMYISFVSLSGSYSGSSIYYWAIFDFHDATTDGAKVAGSLCDEVLERPLGKFRSPRNTLVFKESTEDIVCNYKIKAKEIHFTRIALNIESTQFKSKEKKCKMCWKNENLDRIEVVDPLQIKNITESCFSFCNTKAKSILYSKGTELTVKLSVNHELARQNYYKSKQPIFIANYKMLHPPICGPVEIIAKDKGSISFPVLRQPGIKLENIECMWDMMVHPNRDIMFQVSNVTFPRRSCEDHSLEVKVPGEEKALFKECGKMTSSKELKVSKKLSKLGVVQLHVKMKDINNGGFALTWSY